MRYFASLLAILALLGGCGQSPTAAPEAEAPKTDGVSVSVSPEQRERGGITTGRVNLQKLSDPVEVTGEMRSFSQSKSRVDTPLAGKLIRVMVNPGDQVVAGQPVAVLQSTELARLLAEYHHAERRLALLRSTHQDKNTIARLGAENQGALEEARVQLQSAHLREDQALTQRNLETKALARVEALLTPGIASQKQVEKARASLRQSELAFDAAVQARTAATKRFQREQALWDSGARTHSATLTNTAEVDLAQEEVKHLGELLQVLGKDPHSESPQITLNASQAGTVKTLNSEVGQQLSEGQTVVEIVRQGSVYPIVFIPESGLGLVRVGDPVQVRFGGTSKPIAATLSTLAPELDRETRTLEGRLQLASPQQRPSSGVFLKAEIEANQREALAVPIGAVTDYEGQKVVYVEDSGGKFHRQPVVLGARWHESQEVLEGLKQGQVVAVSGVFLLKSLNQGTAEE